LPKPADIKAIEVDAWETQTTERHRKVVFQMTSDFETILNPLKPNRKDPSPKKMAYRGQLHVELSGRRQKRIDVFSTGAGEEDLGLRVDDTYYRGGSIAKFNQALIDLSTRYKGNEAPK
jgi:hypothetical protein